MFQSLPTAAREAATSGAGFRGRAVLLGLLLTGAAALPARAQLEYSAYYTQILTGTYTDLGTGGTAITTANTDDANSAAQDIGFSFTYGGQAYTQFILNTNGFIKLGATPPSAVDLYFTDPQAYTGPSVFFSTDPADENIIVPFNYDLESGTGTTEYRMETSGTAPNRVCTVQWKDVSDKAIAGFTKQLDNFSFQIKLYETGPRVEFVYDAPTASSAPLGFRGATCGLIGTGGTEYVTISKNSIAPWETPDIGISDANYSVNGPMFNFRNTVLPAAGLTYRFNSAPANDAGIGELYLLRKRPLSAMDTVSMLVINRGSASVASLAVTLTVTGANPYTETQTFTNVSSGDSMRVSFPNYIPTAVGTSTLMFTVPSDAFTANDTLEVTQDVTTGTYSYADDSEPTESVTLGGSGLWLTRYTAAAASTLQSVKIGFSTETAAVGNRYFAVLTDDQGSVIAQSPLYTVRTADLGLYHTFNFPANTAVAAGDFYVGLDISTANATETGIGLQLEAPVRHGAYYIFGLSATGIVDVADLRFTGGAPVSVRPMIQAVLTSVVGLNEPRLARAVNVFPNPSAGRFNIQLTESGATRVALRVVDNLGRVVYTNAMSDNATKTIDLSALSNGLYTVQVLLDDQVVTRQVSVQK